LHNDGTPSAARSVSETPSRVSTSTSASKQKEERDPTAVERYVLNYWHAAGMMALFPSMWTHEDNVALGRLAPDNQFEVFDALFIIAQISPEDWILDVKDHLIGTVCQDSNPNARTHSPGVLHIGAEPAPGEELQLLCPEEDVISDLFHNAFRRSPRGLREIPCERVEKSFNARFGQLPFPLRLAIAALTSLGRAIKADTPFLTSETRRSIEEFVLVRNEELGPESLGVWDLADAAPIPFIPPRSGSAASTGSGSRGDSSDSPDSAPATISPMPAPMMPASTLSLSMSSGSSSSSSSSSSRWSAGLRSISDSHPASSPPHALSVPASSLSSSSSTDATFTEAARSADDQPRS
jgi:hypothetical protein